MTTTNDDKRIRSPHKYDDVLGFVKSVFNPPSFVDSHLDNHDMLKFGLELAVTALHNIYKKKETEQQYVLESIEDIKNLLLQC